MFERLVRNNVEFSQLKCQRRMSTEIRQALIPIYPDLEDHTSVDDRPLISGMGEIRTWFFTHKGREANDSQMSKINHEEADMVVGLFNYLRQNGNKPSSITVLTFYNGQRKLLLRKLREHLKMNSLHFKVVTVDSYQGEENDIVILSLVRSNVARNIGFLAVENRVCVALSRARLGFYIFGDGMNLCKSSMLWWEIIKIMANEPRRVGFCLPLTCQKHGNMTFVNDGESFKSLSGGCSLPCKERLSCGHPCTVGTCHPFPHDNIECQKQCKRILGCGHPCINACFMECKANCSCKANVQPEETEKSLPMRYAEVAASLPSKHPGQQIISAQAFNEYSRVGHTMHDRGLADLAEQQANKSRLKQLDEENAAALFGFSDAPSMADTMTMVRTKGDGKGGVRNLWAGTLNPAQQPSKGHEKQDSLLD